MTLRLSLVVIGLLCLANAGRAVERSPSAVEVEEPADAAAPVDDAKDAAPARKPARRAPRVATSESASDEAAPAPVQATDAAEAPATEPEAVDADAAPAGAEAPAPAADAPAAADSTLAETTPAATTPAAKTPAAGAPKAPAPLAPAQVERLRAFAKGPLRFTSIGKVKAFMIKMDRNVEYTVQPPKKGATAVAITMVDHANGDKVITGRLEVTKNGALAARVVQLTNACNIGSIDPTVRKQLLASEGPVTSHGRMEVSGNIQPITAVHHREGDVAEDGSMRVKSETESADGKVHMTTITELAPDGLPLAAETTGTIAKGPINLNVNLKLTREVEASATGE